MVRKILEMDILKIKCVMFRIKKKVLKQKQNACIKIKILNK